MKKIRKIRILDLCFHWAKRYDLYKVVDTKYYFQYAAA